MKVLMFPGRGEVSTAQPSGIQAVVHAYAKHFPAFDLELVDPQATSYDLVAIHAGVAVPPGGPFVAHCHGLYWTAHYQAAQWEYDGNAAVIANLRRADAVTVPSPWVAENIARDFRLYPAIVPHGIDLDLWTPAEENPVQFVLWNKNRLTDVCSSEAVSVLARLRPQRLFLSTHLSDPPTPNVEVVGTQPHDIMHALVCQSTVYLASVKETFGIGTLEAMAAARPILGFRHGGTADLVEHGVNGYLAEPGNYEDLANGLDYCFTHRQVLGANSRYLAARWSWVEAVRRVRSVYDEALSAYTAPHNVTVVIPTYNKGATLERAVLSALRQTLAPSAIFIVDNNSTDDSVVVARRLILEHSSDETPISLLHETAQGVAHARNAGLFAARTRYICCLDGDDEILPAFLETCVAALRADQTLGLAYTKLEVVDEGGAFHYPDWPGPYRYDAFLQRQNQVPTCCVFRRDLALRLGGYRQRYAPQGAGAEDAEFWLRMGALGFGGVLATDAPLFRYYLGGAVGGNPNYREPDWLIWHPWAFDRRHPFASIAIPQDNASHQVRQVDLPKVSVIIPCEPAHLVYLVDALDSLEAQTFRLWEAVVVLDGPGDLDVYRRAYPSVRFLQTPGLGSGAARNHGAAAARAPYLLFLDADDWLEPSCLDQMLNVADAEPGHVIYSDYIGRAYGIEDPASLQRQGRLIHYEADSGFAIIRYQAADYDCERAVRQPELGPDGEFYIWNLISSLVPRSWHERIGGFDEAMASWEDWDYWLRLARKGACFVRIQDLLVSYRFYSGTRREIGRQRAAELLDYLREKFKGEKAMACQGCGGRKRVAVAQITGGAQMAPAASSQNMVRVRLMGGDFGKPITVRDHDTNQVHNYGFRKGGDTFLMLRKHAELYPGRFEIVDAVATIVHQSEEPAVTEPPVPHTVHDADDPALAPLVDAQETPHLDGGKRGHGRPKRAG